MEEPGEHHRDMGRSSHGDWLCGMLAFIRPPAFRLALLVSFERLSVGDALTWVGLVLLAAQLAEPDQAPAVLVG